MLDFKRLVKSGFLQFGVCVMRRTETAKLLDLIETLRPQDCGKELIRIGGQGDGGYLIPDDLEGIEYCFSPGVSTESGFENYLADLGIKSFLADYSVDEPPISRMEFSFEKKFLGSLDSENFFTLTTWKDKYIKDYTGDLILQMDIEGCEYEVILSTPDALLNQFRIMVIEFHSLDQLFDPFVFSAWSATFEKILRYFHVAHIHPNNYADCVKVGKVEIPRVLEFTFINKRRVGSTRPQEVFPHRLDARNNMEASDVFLPKCWHSPK